MKSRHALILTVCGLPLYGISSAANPPPAAPAPAASTPAPRRESPPPSVSERQSHERERDHAYEKTYERERDFERRERHFERRRREVFWPIGIYYYPYVQQDGEDSEYTASNDSHGWSPVTDSSPTIVTPGSNYSSGASSYSPGSVNLIGSGSPASIANPVLASAAVDYSSAMDHFNQALKNNPAYKAAVAEKTAAETAVAAMHAKDDGSPLERLAAAQRNFNAGKNLSSIMQDAAAKDDRLKAARAKLDAVLTASKGGIITP